MLQRTGLSFLSLLVLSILFALPASAQTAEAPALFDGATQGPSALNSVGMKRMGTLEQDSTTRSIRMVRLVNDLSQQRALTMQVDRDTRVLAPSVNPAFQRGSENGGGGRTVELSIQRDGINAISEGTYAWRGTVQFNSARGEETVGDVTLVRGADGAVTGTIRVGGEFYLVRPLSGSLHALVEVNEDKYPTGESSGFRYDGGSSPASPQPPSSAESSSSPAQSSASSESTCSASATPLGNGTSNEPNESSRSDAQSAAAAPCPQTATEALVVYTSAAADGQDIDGLINTAIQEANEAYNNSNSYNADLALAHSQQVSFSPTGDIGVDVGNLTTNGTVNSLRDQHDADVVVLLTADVYEGFAGIAKEIRAEAQDAYAIVEAPFATGGEYTFPHEVGHLQGAQHNPQLACHPDNPQADYPACDEEGDFFSNAYGHRFTDEGWCGWLCDDEYATMMANNNDDHSRIKNFSNPNVSHDDESTGTSDRYNADALQTTASTVEDFRISNELRASMTVSGTPGDSERTFTADVCGGTGSYSYTWRISYNGSGNYGPPVGSGESFTKTFPGGTHYVKLTVSSGSQLDTAVRSVWVKGDCSHPPCQLTTTESTSDSLIAKTATTDESPMTKTPKRVALRGAAPNPFRSSTEIVYALPERTDVTLTVYDLMGRQVARLVTGSVGAGTHRIRLTSASLSSGAYIVRLQAGGTQETEQITVVK